MFKTTTITAAILALAATSALAQEAARLERVEITGSSIKRLASEGALPVITLTKSDIERTGASSVAELVAQLPSMQGFTQGSDSVNGGGGGATTASLRGLGSQYTLVLLNGRRIAPYTSGSDVNLEVLPLSMVRRVEVLVDGASAIYGADAVAGVVNFITESDTEAGGLNVRAGKPQRAGGANTKISVSKGFGSVEREGYNVVAGLSIDAQDQVTAQQRPWTSRGGVIPFDFEGQKYLLLQSSGNTNPPNATVNGVTYNPYLVLNKNCGPSVGSFQLGTRCRFNYSATVQLQPQYERKTLFVNGTAKLGGGFTGFFEYLRSDADVTGAFAPPAQPFSITAASPLWNRYIVPTLAAAGVQGAATRATIRMRLEDAGPRTDQFKTLANHFVIGANGEAAGWDVGGYLTHSVNKQTDNMVGGFSDFFRMSDLIAAGKFDPYNQGSAASKAAIAPAVLREASSITRSGLDLVRLNGSRSLFELSGGSAYLGVGAELGRQLYQYDPSRLAQAQSPLYPDDENFIVGGTLAAVPTKATRGVKSAFAEVQLPFFKGFEVSSAVRYDSYDAVDNAKSYDPLTLLPNGSGKQGKAYSKATYKLGLRFQPTKELLLRGSVGTGFRAPTLNQISAPLADGGVISGFKSCPAAATDPLFAGCRNTPYEYRLLSGGTPDTGATALRPESSKQATLGVRFEPSASLSGGLDFWAVKIDNALVLIDQDAAFSDFARYRSRFSVTSEPGTGDKVLTLNQTPVNAAVNKASGIDWDLAWRGKFEFGQLTLTYQGTYLLKNQYDFGFGGGLQTSLGKFGSDNAVALKIQSRLTATLASGGLTNSLTVRHRSGYTDATGDAVLSNLYFRNADGTAGDQVETFSGLKIPAQYLLDWQGKYSFSKSFSVTFGVTNLLDQKPHLSLKSTGSNMVGADPRYSDTVGRAFYASGAVQF